MEIYMEPHQIDEVIEQDKMDKSIKESGWSEYMSFVVDPVIFDEINLIRLGFDPTSLEKL